MIQVRVTPKRKTTAQQVSVAALSRELEPAVIEAAGRATLEVIRALTPRSQRFADPRRLRILPSTSVAVQQFRRATRKRPPWRRRLWRTVNGQVHRSGGTRVRFTGGYQQPRLYLGQAFGIEGRYRIIRTSANVMRLVVSEVIVEDMRGNITRALFKYIRDLGFPADFARRGIESESQTQLFFQLHNRMRRLVRRGGQLMTRPLR